MSVASKKRQNVNSAQDISSWFDLWRMSCLVVTPTIKRDRGMTLKKKLKQGFNPTQDRCTSNELRQLHRQVLNKVDTSNNNEECLQWFTLLLSWMKPRYAHERQFSYERSLEFVKLVDQLRKEIRGKTATVSRRLKRKREEEAAQVTTKHAKICIEVDHCLTTRIRGSRDPFCEDYYVINADVVINILSFVLPNFQSRGTLGLRRVNRLFCYAYHQCVVHWKIPSALTINMTGVQHQPKFDDLWDHWARRILLYRIYRTQDNTEKEQLVQRIVQYNKWHEENMAKGAKWSAVFNRMNRMSEALMLNIPEELFDAKTIVNIGTTVPCFLMNKLLELRQTGLTVLDCALAMSIRLRNNQENCRFNTRHSQGVIIKPYLVADSKWLLSKIAPFVKELHIHDSEQTLSEVLSSESYFPLLKHLELGRFNTPPSNALRSCLPNVVHTDWRLNEAGRQRLAAGCSILSLVFNTIPREGIERNQLLDNDPEKIEAYEELMRREVIFLLEREFGIQVVHQKPFTAIRDEDYMALHAFEHTTNWHPFDFLKTKTIQFLNRRGYVETYETSVYD